MTSLIQDTFSYFAKFPAMDGVIKNFISGSSNKFEAQYSALSNGINNLATKELIPDITDYVFGVDEDIVKKRISDIDGTFLFVDYGNITSDEELQPKVPYDNFLIAVTVATPIKPEKYDPIEALILSDVNLGHIKTIRDTMKADQKHNPFLKHMTFPAEITPWFARELHNSTGWSMLFTKRGVEMV